MNSILLGKQSYILKQRADICLAQDAFPFFKKERVAKLSSYCKAKMITPIPAHTS